MATALSQLQDLRDGIDDGIAVDIPEWASNLLLSSMELSLTSLIDHGRLMLHLGNHIALYEDFGR